MLREMPSLDLGAPVEAPAEQEYPLHDKDFYVEFVTGMLLHTRELRGPADAAEVWALFPAWPVQRRVSLLQLLHKHGQVA
jgi:hypothetical protein